MRCCVVICSLVPISDMSGRRLQITTRQGDCRLLHDTASEFMPRPVMRIEDFDLDTNDPFGSHLFGNELYMHVCRSCLLDKTTTTCCMSLDVYMYMNIYIYVHIYIYIHTNVLCATYMYICLPYIYLQQSSFERNHRHLQQVSWHVHVTGGVVYDSLSHTYTHITCQVGWCMTHTHTLTHLHTHAHTHTHTHTPVCACVRALARVCCV